MTGGVNNSWTITTDQEIFDEPLYPVPSPPNFWSDSPGTPYLSDTDSWLMNASDIDLSAYVGQNLYVGFGSAMLLEPGTPVDHGYIEVSGDGGINWQPLMDFAQYGYYWYIPWYFLIPDSVKTANFRFRFHLVTDSSIEYDGWLIDNAGIGTADYYGYGYKSGTSMTTPHVTGAVALLASQFPSETVTGRIDRILNNVTPLPSLVGTCVTEGMLNLNQAVCLPGIPGNPSPPNAAAGFSVNTILDWDDCAGADSYDVYFGTTSPPPLVATITDSLYDPGALDFITTYYWKVVAKNNCGENTGPEWNFTTQQIVVQYTLAISTTAGGTTDPVPGAHSYDSGTPAEVTAISSPGYNFSQWTGDVPLSHETDNPITITMDSNKNITANFTLVSPGKIENKFAVGDFDNDGKEEVVVDFGSSGTWMMNNSWTLLNPNNPESMIAVDIDGNGDEELVVDFGSIGLWRWNNGWLQLNPNHCDHMIAVDTDGDGDKELVVDFGSIGVWRYDPETVPKWQKINPNNPEFMARVSFGGGADDEVAVDFGSLGVWRYDPDTAQKWQKINPNDPENIYVAEVGDGDSEEEVVVDFGSSVGLWLYNSGVSPRWQKINPNSSLWGASVAFNGLGQDYEVFIDFEGATSGLWMYDYNGSPKWQKINPNEADQGIGAEITDATGGRNAGEEAVVDFGSNGLWVKYKYSGSWGKINPNDTVFMVRVDTDGDSEEEVVVDFGSGKGLWLYDAHATPKWTQIHTNSADGSV